MRLSASGRERCLAAQQALQGRLHLHGAELFDGEIDVLDGLILIVGVVIQAGSLHLIEGSLDRPVRSMRDHDREGRPTTIVEGQESRRLELSGGSWASLLVCHSRVNAWEHGHHDYQHEKSMHQTHAGPQPPGGCMPEIGRAHV